MDNSPLQSPEKKIKLNPTIQMEPEVASNQQKLPKLKDLMAPDELPPSAFSTTVPELTTVQTGEATTTLPQHSQLVVPVLPECIPLIAEVPDVVPVTLIGPPVQHKKGDPIENEEVLISQVLPGYAPSYASDYVPSEINTESYNSFVNTLSFNVSRYPTLTEITDSKNYLKKLEKNETTKPSEADKKKVFDYIPAEYLTGQESGSIAKASNSMCAIVNPEVLSSGRVLTTMTVPVYQGSQPSLQQPPFLAGKSCIKNREENNVHKNESCEADLQGSNKVTKEDLDVASIDDKIIPSATGDKNDKSEKENSLEATSIKNKDQQTKSTTSKR